MSSIFKPSNSKNWCIEFFYQRQRYRRSLKTPHKAQALKLQRIIDNKISEGTIDPNYLFQKPGNNKTLRVFSGEFIRHIEARTARYSERTIETYCYSARMLSEAWGDIHLRDFTEYMVEFEIRPNLEDRFGSMATVKHHMINFGTMFSLAVKWDLISKNPFSGMIPRLAKKQPVYFKEEEIRAIADYFNSRSDWTRTYFQLMLDTGMRKSELFRLTWSAVNLHPEEPFVRVYAKRKERTVPLNRMGERVLREAERNPESDRVFWQLQSISGINKAWRVAREKLGLEHYRIHNFRSNFATWFVINGGSIVHLMDIMGWENYETAKIYRAVAQEFMRANRNRVDFEKLLS